MAKPQIAVDLLKCACDILSINSVSSKGTRQVAEYYAALLRQVGLQTELLESKEGKGQVNLLGFSEQTLKPELLINTHLDTVEVEDVSLWTQTLEDPFHPVIRAGKIFGLGSADTKLALLCQIIALSHLQKPLRKPLLLVGTFGEERGLRGARELLSRKALQPRYVIVSEPSELKIIYQNKGHLVLDWVIASNNARLLEDQEFWQVTFPGESVHSGTPHLGKSPFVPFFEILRKEDSSLVSFEGGDIANRIPAFARAIFAGKGIGEKFRKNSGIQCERVERKEKRGIAPAQVKILLSFFEEISRLGKIWEKEKDPAFNPPHSTAAVTVLKMAHDKSVLTASLRILPDVDAKALLERFQRKTTELSRHSSEKVTLTQRSLSPAYRTDPGNELVQKCKAILDKLGIQTEISSKSTATEAPIYGSTGAQTIVFGPGVSFKNAHCPNEYNDISQLESATQFYQEVISVFCT